MARHGENIRKREDGRWEGRYPIYSEEKGKKMYRSVYGRTYKEVKEKLVIQKNGFKTLAESGQTVFWDKDVLETILFTDVAMEWLLQVRDTKKRSTYVKYTLIYDNYLEKNFQDIYLHKVTDSFVAEKLTIPLTGSAGKSVYCVLNQILKYASKKYLIPMQRIKSPVSGTGNKPVEVLTRGEQAQLFSVLHQEMDIFKMAVLLCLYTGLRLGEVCALKWSDIDNTNRLIKVSRTVQRLYAEGYRTKTILLETTPKSEFSKREIPVPAEILALLMQFQNNQVYVFGGRKPVEPRTLQNHFKKIIRKVGLSDKNFHILRHTFATNCIEGGTDVKSLSEILGHSDVQITLNRYVHPTMDTKRKHMNALSSFYGQIYGQVS